MSAKPAQIKPDKLLDAARQLVSHHEAQGRPKQSFLRRGVSTAYYALFHALVWGTVSHLLPDASVEERLALARSVDHGALRKVCGWIANPGGAPPHVAPLVTKLSQSAGLVNVALDFQDLQQARHAADYDHFAGLSKPAALQYVATAEAAIKGMAAVPASTKQGFYALVAMHVRKIE